MRFIVFSNGLSVLIFYNVRQQEFYEITIKFGRSKKEEMNEGYEGYRIKGLTQKVGRRDAQLAPENPVKRP